MLSRERALIYAAWHAIVRLGSYGCRDVRAVTHPGSEPDEVLTLRDLEFFAGE